MNSTTSLSFLSTYFGTAMNTQFRSRSFAMKQFYHSPSRATLVAALIAVLAVPSAWAMDSGSTGADGAFNPTVNTEVQLPESGILNYTTVNIPAGVTVKFKKNTANTPVHILASGDVTIAGTIDIRGLDAKHVGTYSDGVLGDDGIPGDGGPGGYSGGRGGRDDAALRPAIVRGGHGLGPGGGPGGIEGADGCTSTAYYKYVGTGGAYAQDTFTPAVTWQCGSGIVPRVKAYGSALLQPLVGGSGGGGGRGGPSYSGSGGGGGGGAILIASTGTLTVTGTINATGGDSGGLSGEGMGGRGAGGSGGAIRLMATRMAGNGSLLADGGCVNNNNQRRQLCGIGGSHNHYGGSPGRIRVEAETHAFSFTSSPTLASDTPGSVFIASAPTLRIASVGGQAVPANPTGTADLTFPAATSSAPVQVGFETANVPVGNNVHLRVVPAYGTMVEAISPAISGSTAAGTASVSITLPSGPSTLQATTTYTVVVVALEDEALSDKLSRMAQNERVEKVEVTVALEGGATAKLITVSGKSFELPYEALTAVGFRG
jgi:hypothetical protein